MELLYVIVKECARVRLLEIAGMLRNYVFPVLVRNALSTQYSVLVSMAVALFSEIAVSYVVVLRVCLSLSSFSFPRVCRAVCVLASRYSWAACAQNDIRVIVRHVACPLIQSRKAPLIQRCEVVSRMLKIMSECGDSLFCDPDDLDEDRRSQVSLCVSLCAECMHSASLECVCVCVCVRLWCGLTLHPRRRVAVEEKCREVLSDEGRAMDHDLLADIGAGILDVLRVSSTPANDSSLCLGAPSSPFTPRAR